MSELTAPRVAVGAIVIDQRTDGPYVLLVQRGREPALGQWSLPGGKVERGERLSDALKREILEETGLEVSVGRLVEVAEIIETEYHFVILDYLCARVGGELRAGDDAQKAEWAAVFDLAEYGLTRLVRRAISKAIADEKE